MMKDKITIKGIAVKEGISRNKRKYTSVELEKFAPTMIGRPLLKDHEGLTDNVIGKITDAYSNDGGKTVEYTGWVKEDGSGIIEKIKDGRISEVSIGAIAGKVVKENKDDDFIIPTNMEALELSTTPVPGNKGTSIGFEKTEYTESQLKEMIKSHLTELESSDSLNTIERRMNMKADKELIKIDTKESVEDNTTELVSMKEQIVALKKDNENLNSTIKDNAISRYNEKCTAKGINSKDLSNANMEMIQFAIEMVDEVPEEAEAEAEVEVKPEAKEEVKDEKEEEKPEAETQSVEPTKEESEEEDALEGYVITAEGCSRGFAFYKHY